jgi:cell division protein FtsI/penicillin-binding protein 2
VRIRDILAVLVGLAVVGAIGYGAWTWLSETVSPEDPEPEPGRDPVATAEAYVDAWEQGDHLAMVRFVRDPPDDFVARHVQMLDALEPTGMAVTAGDMRSPQEGRAQFPLTVALEVDYAQEPLSWETTLEMIRERGEWGVVWSLTTIHPELRESWEFGSETEEVDRQDILAADGTVLSGERTLVTFGFEPTAVDDPDEVVAAFAEALPGSEARAERELNRGDLVDGWFYPIVTVPEQRASDVRPMFSGIPGVLRQTAEGRGLYDEGFAQHVVGIVSEATAEQLEQRDLPADTRIHIGQYGLERDLEDQLEGSEIVRVGLRERDGTGGLQVVLTESQADPSAPVETTLDITVQRAIENALFGESRTVGVVAVDAGSGAILGSASRPLTGFNRALEGRYPPGSTFKVVTLEALLRDGASPEDTAECPAETTVGGLRIRNAGDRGHGTVDLREAFALSCNTTFATYGGQLGADAMVEAAERFGFNHGWELPLSSFGGSFPEPSDTAEVGAAAFGQARVEASVVHMASVAAAAATGQWYAPYLLQGEGPTDPRPLSEGVVDQLRVLMRAVVTDGTGTDADVPGTEVLGKTGTAQGTGGVEHAWFIGFYDGVGFAVLVEEGGAGGEVAAPIAARFVRELVSLRGEDSGEDASDDEEDEDEGEG